jgi:hypothetical protein
MHDQFNQYLPVLLPAFFVTVWVLSIYLVAAASGWRLLATRFRAQGPFTGQSWRMQFARMRWMTNYNNALTIGADSTGLFMAPMVLFRVWHPPLFIPWTEITLVGARHVLFFTLIELRLGSSERIPFKIKSELAAKLRAAAGTAWPGESAPAIAAPPPPIS